MVNRIPKVKQAKVTRRQVAEPGDMTVQKDVDILKSQQNKLMKEYKAEVYDNLRDQLFTSSEDESGDINSPISKFVKRYVNEAISDPTSKAANVLANTIFKDNLLELLDSDKSEEMKKTKDFNEYRLIKQFYDKQRDIILDCNKFRKIIAITSRRTGKTTMNAGLCVFECLTPNSNVAYINLTFSNTSSFKSCNLLIISPFNSWYCITI